MNNIFNYAVEMNFTGFIMSAITSISLGVLIAFIYSYKNNYSKNFLLTLAILPLLVQSVIMLVNGNVGTGVAVLGAFSLIRFRSVAGTSREIVSIFWSMGVGLATGMGQLGYVIIFSILSSIILIIFSSLKIENNNKDRVLKIIISEDLDYPDLFTDVFTQYTDKYSLEKVQTTDMGSLYEIVYNIRLKNLNNEKQIIDAVRIKNGNLPVTSGKSPVSKL